MSTIQSRTPWKKAKNHVTLIWKFPWKSCSTTYLPLLSSNPKILKAFLKLFLTKWNPLNAQQRKKKWGKKIKRGGEKAKSKSQDSCVTFKTQNYLEILLSAHTRTSKANILHLHQKAAKCVNCTCKGLCGKFKVFIAWQWSENCSTSFKMCFQQNFHWQMG